MSGWAPALRMARRDAWRAKRRTALVLALVALPVAVVVGLDTAARTSDLTPVERLDRQLGRSAALVVDTGLASVDQDPTSLAFAGSGSEPRDEAAADRVAQVLPQHRVLPVVTGEIGLRAERGARRPQAQELDLTDPLTTGLYALTSGRLPATAGEVAVTDAFADANPDDVLETLDGELLTVVGTVVDPEQTLRQRVVALPGTLSLAPQGEGGLLLDGPAVGYDQVLALNALGLAVLSREVVQDPPPASQVPSGPALSATSGGAVVVALVVAMAVLQVVLLAGPAFAVGARRARRTLALVEAVGGEPAHVRRVVLATGLVLGAAASVLGACVGVMAAASTRGLQQRFADTLLGPFEVSPLVLVVVVLVGTASAVGAAVLPAVSETRLSVVEVLAGRRSAVRPPRGSAVAGLALLGVGVLVVLSGTVRGSGEYRIALGAVPVVLGVVLLSPAVVGALGGLARVLPLAPRLAVRDAARSRSRTAPAVAAVAATVAAVVALGTGASSDQEQARATYQPQSAAGSAVLSGYGLDEQRWDEVVIAARGVAPAAEAVRGLVQPDDGFFELCRPEDLDAEFCEPVAVNTYVYGGDLLVGERALALAAPDPADRARAAEVLARGGIAVTSAVELGPTIVLRLQTYNRDGQGVSTGRSVTVPVVRLPVPAGRPSVQAVLSPQVAEQLGQPVVTTSVVVPVPVGAQQESALVSAVEPLGISVQVERGFDAPPLGLLLLALSVGAGLLVLAGTVTATLLALTDARPDLATLQAVGAGPRLPRAVAASYALVVALVGAVLGVAAGLVPGIAIAFPLTRNDTAFAVPAGSPPLPEVFVDVPWLLVGGLVVVLPLVAAAIVAACTSTRLPLTSRQAT